MMILEIFWWSRVLIYLLFLLIYSYFFHVDNLKLPTVPIVNGSDVNLFNSGPSAEFGKRSRKGGVLAITLVSIILNKNFE